MTNLRKSPANGAFTRLFCKKLARGVERGVNTGRIFAASLSHGRFAAATALDVACDSLDHVAGVKASDNGFIVAAAMSTACRY